MAKRKKGIGFWHSVFPNQLGNLCFAVLLLCIGMVVLYGMFDLNVFDPDSFHRAKSARSASSDEGAPVIPELGTRRVVDEAGVLTPGEIENLTREIDAFEAASGGQMAVLLIQSLHGNPVDDFSFAVAEKWQIGQKDKDNGVLLLLAVDDRLNRMEVGRGLEGVITDGRSSRILRDMAPLLKRERYAQAISYAIRSVSALVRNETEPETPEDPAGGPEDTLFGIIFFCLFCAVAGTIAACVMIRPDVRKSVGLLSMILLGRFIVEILILAARSGGHGGGRGSGGGSRRSGGGGGRFSGGGASGRW